MISVLGHRIRRRPKQLKLLRPFLDHEVLERLHDASTNDVGRRLGLDDDLFAGLRVDAFASLCRRLLHQAKLDEAGKNENARALFAELALHRIGEGIKNSLDLLLGQTRSIREMCNDL